MTAVVDGTMAGDRQLHREDCRRAAGRLPGVPADPQHRHAPRARRRHAGRGRLPRRSACERWASSTSRRRRHRRHPIVYADWLHAEGAPTILVYTHYDVQPVDPLDLWNRPPFDPVIENGRVYARGAADDKSHAHLHLWAARAWLETQGRLPGQPAHRLRGRGGVRVGPLRPVDRGQPHRLAADLAMISDTGFFEGNQPAITVGLRGLVYMQIDVTGSKLDLHSGSFGGNVQNPANALATIIAAAQERRWRGGRARLLRRGRRITPREREEFDRLSSIAERSSSDHGLHEVFGERGSRLSSGAAHGPHSTSTGSGAASRAKAPRRSSRPRPTPRSAARLVPDMDPRADVRTRAGLRGVVAPAGVKVEVTKVNDGMWSRRRSITRPCRPRRTASRTSSGSGRTTSTRAARCPAASDVLARARPARRVARFHPARRPGPRPQRVNAPRQLRGRSADARPLLAESWAPKSRLR